VEERQDSKYEMERGGDEIMKGLHRDEAIGCQGRGMWEVRGGQRTSDVGIV